MRFLGFVLASAMALGASAALAQSVSTDFDASAAFASFHSYGWAPGSRPNLALNDARIVRAIDAQLAVKGLTQIAASSRPDVLVTYHMRFDENLRVRGSGFGPGFVGAGLRTARVEPRTVAILIIDLMDADSGALVWRSISRREIDPNASAERREKNINKSVAKMFRNYPPER